MKYKKLIFYLLIFIAIGDTLSNIGNAGFNDESFTPLSFIVKYLALSIIIYFSSKSNWNEDIPTIISLLLKLFLVWNIFTIIRGAFFAIDYWDWKFLLLSSLLFFLIPMAFFLGNNFYLVRLILKYILKYFFTFGFLIIPLAIVTNRELYSRLMIPISVFILLIPYLKPKWRKLILFIAVVSILIVIDFRSNIIKTSISLLILSLYYFRRYVLQSWIKVIHILIFALPLLILYLGVSGQYNIFVETSQNNSYTIKAQKGDLGNEDLAADTRTFLYVEVLTSLAKNGTLLMGEGASGKYKTDYFDTFADHRGRYGSEVGFLNVLLYSGIIGVVIYFLILFFASYFAINNSNNFLCKMLGLLIAGRWLLFFIEEFTSFDLNTLFTWLVIGLVCTREFRMMNERDMKLFFNVL
ncbi:hypothetical protein JN11_00339 [Mucilaginibacter frigoritolerans]|uniref:O-antigen ligase-like membrane protein n=1 Tax=Mucilaginibacter frigoritolerans TaxID=652788 RepID=A0A562UFL6_9SPHI|nr:hypothetical protein [Mucilaginibacter frigoritolerans]TWJ04622.1 hypothetical protein JN11_00339 [Mucilaginibacter frigoritolerans]